MPLNSDMKNSPQSLTERVVKGSGVVLLFTFLGSPIGYLIRVLYSNSLSIEMFGLFYAALAFFALLSTYLDFGLGISCSYFIPKFLKKQDFSSVATIFHYTQIAELLVTLVAALFLYLSADWLAVKYFKSPSAVNLIYIFSIYLIANSIFTALNALFVGFQNEKYYASMHFFRLFFILVFSTFFWFFDFGNVLYFAATWVAGTILMVVVYYLLLARRYSFVLQKFHNDPSLLKRMISYGFPTLLTTSLFTFISSTDTLFLTYFHGLKDVGVYNVVLPLATLSGLFLTPINALILPLISHLMEGEESKIVYLVQSLLKLVPFIGIYFALFLSLFPGQIITTLFGAKWSGLAETSLIIFSLGFIWSPLSNFLVIILSGMGKTNERLKLSFLVAILNIILCFLLIPRFGVIGAVIANSLVYMISVVIFTKMIERFFQITYSYMFYVKLLLLVGVIFIFVKALGVNPNGLIQISIVGLLYTIPFLIFGFTQDVLDTKTRKLLMSRIFKGFVADPTQN